MRTTRDLFRPFLVAIGLAITLAWLATAGPVAAHGSVSEPPSRTYTCRFLQTDTGACARAWAANPQALYDWMEVNIGDAAGQHQAKIPDGRLCSAGRAKYAAFDEAAADWPTTALTPNAAGRYTIGYEATAPHATEYFRLYITRADYQPTQPLRWSDLELVHDSGPLSAEPTYRFEVSLPERSGHHILYQVWQRSDSPEAFYACSDVTLATGGATPGTTATTAAPTTSAPTSSPASTPTTTPATTAASSPASSTEATSRPPTSPTTAGTTGQVGTPSSSTVPGSGATVTSNDVGGSSSPSSTPTSTPTTATDGTSSTAVAAGAGSDEQPGSAAQSATGSAIDSSEVSLVERAADTPGLGSRADGGDPADEALAIAAASAGETDLVTDVGQAGAGSGRGEGGNQLPLLILAVVFGIVAAVLMVIGQRRAWLDRVLDRRNRNREPVVKPQSQWRQQPEWR